jgi:hypothetical protein
MRLAEDVEISRSIQRVVAMQKSTPFPATKITHSLGSACRYLTNKGHTLLYGLLDNGNKTGLLVTTSL